MSLRLSSLLNGVVLTALLLTGPARAADPSWFKRKQKIAEEQKTEESMKGREQPIVDGGDPNAAPVSQLSSPKETKVETNLLFKAAGVTDTFHLDYSYLSQDEVNGPTLTAGFAMGWWWQPNLIVSGFGRVSGTNWNSVTLMMVTVGPQIRYLASKRWSFAALFGYTYSHGLNREKERRIPVEESALRSRHGFTMGAQSTYFFWPKRDLAIGPTLGIFYGIQDERTPFQITLGVTFLAGRPNYTGDVTAW